LQILKKVIREIMEKVEYLHQMPERGRICPELKLIGYTNYREIIFHVGRLLYKIVNKDVISIGIIDSRRNFDEV